MTLYWIAQVISFIGNFGFTCSALFKRKRTIILLQSINHVLSSIAEILLGAWSALTQEITCLIKNIVLLFVPESKTTLRLVINIICIIVALVCGITFNIWLSNGVWYGYLPVAANLIYSSIVLFCFIKKGLSRSFTEFIIKLGLLINGICWVIYGYKAEIWPAMIFNCITIIISIISMIRIVVEKNKPDGVRTAKMSDIEDIMDMLNLCKKDMKERGLNVWTDNYPNLEIITKDIKSKNAVVYSLNNKAVAYLVMCPNHKADNEEIYHNHDNFCLIQRVMVHPDYRRHGYAQAILLHVERKDFKSIRLLTRNTNTYSVNLYHKLGYNVVNSYMNGDDLMEECEKVKGNNYEEN